MKATYLRIISLLLVLVMLMSFGLTSCKKDDENNEPDTENNENNDQTPGDDTPGEDTPGEENKPGTGDGSDNDPEEEYTLPKEEGHNQLTIYWDYTGNISTASFWIWNDGGDGRGYFVYKCDYGVKCIVNIPKEVTKVGFIACYGCDNPGGTTWIGGTKDVDADRFVEMNGDTTIYLKRGNPMIFRSEEEANAAGTTISSAFISSFNTIKYTLAKTTTISSLDEIKINDGTKDLTITKLTSINKKSNSGVITLSENIDLSKVHTITIDGFSPAVLLPMGVFDTKEFIDNYTYDGDDLGAVISGDTTTFKVWAPTASSVVLNLFESGHEGTAYESVEMTKGDRGVWSHTANCGHGTYYTYTVTTAVGTQEAVDPYAKAAGANGDRGMVVDLSLTDPEGWGAEFSTGIDSYSDAIIWEVHVRDFSGKIASSNYKGKYLAFTERGLVNEYGQPVGVDYLVNLGITHVHLLPVYDYATVDETNPDSEFNWGYDPKNYNVPEGSYSTNPYDGVVRIKEYKEMVKALHEAGIGVVMDVVYNHTYSANSSFNKIVPYYYYRYNSLGANTSASGCGNDTASERYMFGKFMVDSVSYWITEYDLDGFRFDLMGLHDLDTMQEIESAVHNIDPEAIIYGEGWKMGATIDGSKMANQTNISEIEITNNAIGSIAVFNDAIRDGLKGSVFESASKGYISGSGQSNLEKVMFGINGGCDAGQGWKVTNAMIVNYMSAHDNNTLWDKLELSNGTDTIEARLAMNRLGATLLMVSKGMTFFQAGEEMLRTKDGDENSYKSSDAINNIDWSVLDDGTIQQEMMLFYKGLIEMRKTYGIFTDPSASAVCNKGTNGRCTISIMDRNGHEILIVSNPTAEVMEHTLDSSWRLLSDGSSVTVENPELITGSIEVAPYSAYILISNNAID